MPYRNLRGWAAHFVVCILVGAALPSPVVWAVAAIVFLALVFYWAFALAVRTEAPS